VSPRPLAPAPLPRGTCPPGARLRVLLIDHRDSFTFNIVHLLGRLGAEVTVRDSRSVEAGDLEGTGAIVLGPGPHGPGDVPESAGWLRAASGWGIPVLGICLGMQILGASTGGTVRRATRTAHGVLSRIRHGRSGIFRGLTDPACFVRYHSLVLAEPLPPGLEVTARDEDGDVAAVAHRGRPLWGVQFHPESALSREGDLLMDNFLRMARKSVRGEG
jgi:anthranilate synthase/aminodeoxychorismate synthase-like glutamine amidotransferase